MNGIRLFFRGQKGGVLSALTLFVVLGAVLLALNYALSQYLYIRRAGAMLERARPCPTGCTLSTRPPMTRKTR